MTQEITVEEALTAAKDLVKGIRYGMGEEVQPTALLLHDGKIHALNIDTEMPKNQWCPFLAFVAAKKKAQAVFFIMEAYGTKDLTPELGENLFREHGTMISKWPDSIKEKYVEDCATISWRHYDGTTGAWKVPINTETNEVGEWEEMPDTAFSVGRLVLLPW